MKTFIFNLVLVFSMMVSTNLIAQTQDQSKLAAVKTESYTVSGNCSLCKARIEKAAKLDGVSKAEWNKDTKIITLVYNPAKVKGDDIQKSIALAGHDTQKFKANDKDYKNLPGCCQYEREK